VPDLEAITAVAGRVRDPELPMLTLADLGVLRGIGVEPGPDGEVVVASITPTYSGCPATAQIARRLLRRLRDAGCPRVEVRLVLDPPWSSDWISARGREALRAAGISPPGRAPDGDGPVPLTLLTIRPATGPHPPARAAAAVRPA